MIESPRGRLHRLISEFRTGSLDTESFCGRFDTTYNLELDIGTLVPTEAEAFAALFEKVVWYSPFPEERKQIPHYLGEEDIARAVERAAQRLTVVRLRIPYWFVRDRTRMSWRDVRFGLAHEHLDPQAPIELAIEQVDEYAKPSAALLELAAASPDEPTFELVEKLANDEPPRSENEIRDKWLYLVLAWIYEHRDAVSDPLQRIVEVYTNFDYPQQIVEFVKPLPMKGADLGPSREAAERRLFERWKRYLEEYESTHPS